MCTVQVMIIPQEWRPVLAELCAEAERRNLSPAAIDVAQSLTGGTNMQVTNRCFDPVLMTCSASSLHVFTNGTSVMSRVSDRYSTTINFRTRLCYGEGH